jgi:hypothetical protein
MPLGASVPYWLGIQMPAESQSGTGPTGINRQQQIGSMRKCSVFNWVWQAKPRRPRPNYCRWRSLITWQVLASSRDQFFGNGARKV